MSKSIVIEHNASDVEAQNPIAPSNPSNTRFGYNSLGSPGLPNCSGARNRRNSKRC